ncbi:flagellar basal body-associated protein FliL [Leptolinea tardivitalis]|uniref:flagellar basal body-associated FliL family protein n=1 Tax=Leptolinea tardivitalis TaxID=229920 RepID=UPI0007862022|nr:flagellar basal body-associated FliL family protein [Leptolinea tardivitalis]GAP22482.1 flagellar basal body-associated protein [Leptolinea tardivitalis]
MSTDAPAKPKAKTNVFKIIIYFVAGVILMTTAVTNLLVVYVLFAPDTFPKPIYLVYQLPVGVTQPAVEGAAPAAGEQVVNGGSANPIAIITGRPAAAEPSQPAKANSSSNKKNSNSSGDVQPGQGIMIDTGTKIVNLAEPGGKKFIRVTATLEFAPPEDYANLKEEEKTTALATFTTELNSKLPILDDIIVTILSSKDFQSVYTAEGKEALRQEIMDTVNNQLPDYRVIRVYFKEFVMQ